MIRVEDLTPSITSYVTLGWLFELRVSDSLSVKMEKITHLQNGYKIWKSCIYSDWHRVEPQIIIINIMSKNINNYTYCYK